MIHDLKRGVLIADRRGGVAMFLARQWVADAGAINQVSIAPDATFAVFDRRNTQRSDVFTVPVGGGPERRLTADGNSLAPTAEPEALAFTRYVVGRRPREELWLMQHDGTNQRRLSQAVARPTSWSAESWSATSRG